MHSRVTCPPMSVYGSEGRHRRAACDLATHRSRHSTQPEAQGNEDSPGGRWIGTQRSGGARSGVATAAGTQRSENHLRGPLRPDRRQAPNSGRGQADLGTARHHHLPAAGTLRTRPRCTLRLPAADLAITGIGDLLHHDLVALLGARVRRVPPANDSQQAPRTDGLITSVDP